MIDFLEDYPSPAEGNGLENRQVAEMSRVGSNPTSSFVKEKTLTPEGLTLLRHRTRQNFFLLSIKRF